MPSQRSRKKQGKREEDLSGLPVIVVEHSMTQEELAARFGEDGFKQLPDEVYRRYRFTPAKIEVEEHHVKVYAGKKTEEVVKAPHQECLLTGSLVSPSLEAAVMNAKIEKISDEMYHMAGGAQSYSSLVCSSVSFLRNSSAA